MNTDKSRRSNADDIEHVVRVLEEDIIFGRLHQRERLIEDVLMERFQIKRYVVRQALAELERLGIVVKERNKGATVRSFDRGEVEAIYEMRELLHEKAIRRIPLPADITLIAELEDIHERHAAATAARDLRAIYILNDEFHRTLYGACGNPYLTQSIIQYDWLSHPIRSLRIGDAALSDAAADEHAQMIEALRQQNRERLLTLCRDHILPSKNSYLELYGWSSAQ